MKKIVFYLFLTLLLYFAINRTMLFKMISYAAPCNTVTNQISQQLHTFHKINPQKYNGLPSYKLIEILKNENVLARTPICPTQLARQNKVPMKLSKSASGFTIDCPIHGNTTNQKFEIIYFNQLNTYLLAFSLLASIFVILVLFKFELGIHINQVFTLKLYYLVIGTALTILPIIYFFLFEAWRTSELYREIDMTMPVRINAPNFQFLPILLALILINHFVVVIRFKKHCYTNWGCHAITLITIFLICYTYIGSLSYWFLTYLYFLISPIAISLTYLSISQIIRQEQDELTQSFHITK